MASISTREIQQIDAIANRLHMTVDIDEAYRVDTKPFIERPFYVGEVVFSDASARYSLLSTPIKYLPGDIARSNPSLLNMFKIAAYGRPELVINCSMAGTITHAGCVLVGVLPPMPAYPTGNKSLINTILSGPHAKLFANEATSVAISVPWYCNTDMATLDMDQTAGYVPTLDITTTNGNYGTLVFLVLNPLTPSNGSSKEISIIVEAVFKNFDMVVPTPRYPTWISQSGFLKKRRKCKPQAMANPIYHDKPEVIIHTVTTEAAKGNWFHDNRDLILTATTVLATTLGAVVKCVADYNPESTFKPESLISALTSPITGILKSAVGSATKVVGDALDSGASSLIGVMGLHNPNDPVIAQRVVTTHSNFPNITDEGQLFEKLDPYTRYNRVVQEPIFGSDIDEMAVAHITAKDQMIGSVKVTVDDRVGKLLWARPISPQQGGLSMDKDNGLYCTNNLEYLHSVHRAWRGNLKIKIESVMNNKQQIKLKLLKYYNPSVRVTAFYPTYQSIANAPSHLMEFTQGGQVHEIELPFLSRNDLMPCAENLDVEAIMHGMYYIFVAQPLANSDGSPTTVEFNIYISGGTKLQFYGYANKNTYFAPMKVIGSGSNKTALESLVDSAFSQPLFTDNVKKVTRQSKHIPLDCDYRAFLPLDAAESLGMMEVDWNDERKKIDPICKKYNMTPLEVYAHCNSYIPVDSKIRRTKEFVHDEWEAQSGTVEVMNKPQVQKQNINAKPVNLGHDTRLLPTVDIRPLIRRMYKANTQIIKIEPNMAASETLHLGDFLGENPAAWAYTPIHTISQMYYGKTVGFKIRIVYTFNRIDSQSFLETLLDGLKIRAYYVPQNISYLSNTNTITRSGINVSSFTPPGTVSSIGDIPFTYQVRPIEITPTTAVYEFVVPDTSIFKFMGGPDKFKDFNSAQPATELATTDFGSLIIQMFNVMPRDMELCREVFVGLTDESRFGFHCIAPAFYVTKTTAYYTGTATDTNGVIPNTINPYTYRGGFL